MAFVLPSFEAGELVVGGLRVPSLETGELTVGGLKVPSLEGGELAIAGLRVPSLSVGAHSLTNDLQIPILEVGDLRDDLNMSVVSFGTEADAQITFYADAPSSVGIGSSGLSQWVMYPVVTIAATVSGPVVGGLTMSVATTSTAAFVTTCAAPTIFWEVVTTGVTFDGTILGTRLVDATVTGVVTANGAVVGSASYHVSAASEAQIQDGVQFVQDFWDGWAFNLNTGAPSMYEDFKFNSFARIGNNYYGCNDTGIYLLGGDLDAAAEIDATVTTGYSDLSTDKFDGGQVKHVTTAYLDARAASPMTITCRTEGQEYTYTFDTDRTNMASARAEIGKGLKGTLWQFELKNVAGADFEVESLAVLVDPTKRKA